MRTEQEILKEFEALGYEIKVNSISKLKLSFEFGYLEIHKKAQLYQAYIDDEDDEKISQFINMQEHQLLNELFTIWEWI